MCWLNKISATRNLLNTKFINNLMLQFSGFREKITFLEYLSSREVGEGTGREQEFKTLCLKFRYRRPTFICYSC